MGLRKRAEEITSRMSFSTNRRKEVVWEGSPWGSRQAFIQSCIEKENYSQEAAERSADEWEDALLDLQSNPPSSLSVE
jgi:hypothetical protein